MSPHPAPPPAAEPGQRAARVAAQIRDLDAQYRETIADVAAAYVESGHYVFPRPRGPLSLLRASLGIPPIPHPRRAT